MPRGAKPKFSEEVELEICRLYQESNKNSTKVLAKQYGCSHPCIRAILERHGISRRNNQECQPMFNKIITDEKDGGRHFYRRIRELSDCCKICEGTLRLHLHHKDGNHFNNDPNNMITVCNSCHLSIHKYKPINTKKLLILYHIGFTQERIAKKLGVSITKVGWELSMLSYANYSRTYDVNKAKKIRYYASLLQKE